MSVDGPQMAVFVRGGLLLMKQSKLQIALSTNDSGHQPHLDVSGSPEEIIFKLKLQESRSMTVRYDFFPSDSPFLFSVQKINSYIHKKEP